MRTLVLVTGPTVEPVSRAEAKLHCRIDTDLTADDSYVDALITAARRHIERRTQLQLVNATWKQVEDRFPPWEMTLAKSPLVSVSSIRYRDVDGDWQTLDSATYEAAIGSPGRLAPVDGEQWPTLYPGLAGVEVTYVAGHGATAASVPEELRLAVKWLVAHWYRNREAVDEGTFKELPLGVLTMIQNYRVYAP